MKRFKQGKRIFTILMAASIAASSSMVVLADGTGENLFSHAEEVTEAETSIVEVESESVVEDIDSEKSWVGHGVQESEQEFYIPEINKEIPETELITESNSEEVGKKASENKLNIQQNDSNDLILNDWDYEVQENIILLKKYIGKNENIVIPSQINIKEKLFSVVIAKNTNFNDYINGAFGANRTIKTIKFLDGVNFEDNDMTLAFADCYNLESVSGIPDSVMIMNNTFFRCSSLTKVDKLPLNLKELDGAFFHCTSLEEIPQIPNGVNRIRGCFEECEKLKRGPDIPDGVTDISFLFSNCINLTEIGRIPDTVNSMKNTFKNCENLYIIEKLPEQLSNMDETFYGCKKLVQVADIPKGVTQLNVTFFNCVSLKQMPVLPSGLKSMNSSFAGCSSIVSSVPIPDNVMEMNYTFMNCSQLLKSPELPSGLTAMAGLFQECKKLENPPKIPDGVVNMYGSFAQCTSLKKVPALPSKVQDLGFAFESCIRITKAPDIPESVVNLGWAFSGCSNLKGSMTIYASLTKMIDDSIAGRHLAYTGCFDQAASNSSGLTVNYGPNCKNIKDIIELCAYNNKKVKKGQLVLQVKFKANGGTTEKSYKNVYYNKKYGKLPTPRRAKYSFSGWYTKKSGGTRITTSSRITAKKNITLYAHWKKVTVGKVSSISLKNTKSKRMTVNTKAVSGAKGYLITYARNASFTRDKKSLFTSYTKKNVNKLLKNKKYYVKVRAYKLDSTGKKIYGKYSSVKKIKIAK